MPEVNVAQVRTAACCAGDLNKSHHPNINFNGSKKQQGKQKRSFQKVWLTEFPWLTYCDSHHNIFVFCFYCREAKSKGYFTFSKIVDGAFTESGFSNWKRPKKNLKNMRKVPAIKKRIQNMKHLKDLQLLHKHIQPF